MGMLEMGYKPSLQGHVPATLGYRVQSTGAIWENLTKPERCRVRRDAGHLLPALQPRGLGAQFFIPLFPLSNEDKKAQDRPMGALGAYATACNLSCLSPLQPITTPRDAHQAGTGSLAMQPNTHHPPHPIQVILGDREPPGALGPCSTPARHALDCQKIEEYKQAVTVTL